MVIYNINNFNIPSTIFSPDSIKSKFKIVTNSDAVTLKNDLNQQIALNSGSYKAIIQVDGTIYASELREINGSSLYFTYAKQLDVPLNFVIHDNTFSQSSILGDLFALNIEESNDNYVELEVSFSDNKFTISFTSPEQFTVEVDSSGNLTIDGESQSDGFTFTKGSVTIRNISTCANVYNLLAKDRTVSVLDDEPMDDYYYEYDVENKILVKKQIVFDGVQIDKYGSVLNIVKGTSVGVNMESIYDFDREEYLDTNEKNMFHTGDGKISQFILSRLISSIVNEENGIGMYDYGFFKASDILFVSYAYIGSSYAYLTYSKAKAHTDSCVYSDDTSIETGVKFYIKKGKSITIKTNNLDNVVLKHDDADFATQLHAAVRKGVGVFSNPLFNVKKYKDDTTQITVTYNYTNSSNYYEMDIYDDVTRYKIQDNRKVNGNQSTETKYYYRYRTYPEVEMTNTKSKVNMFKKKNYDYVADSAEATVLYSKIDVNSYSIIEKNSVLNVNPNNFQITLPKEKVSVDTFGRIGLMEDGELTVVTVLYQPTTGAIYAKHKDSIMNSDEFVSFFNSVSSYFKADTSCDYTQIKYKNLDGKDITLEFPVSTLFVSEPLNGSMGLFYRVYYKNVSDVGFFEALSYEIKY